MKLPPEHEAAKDRVAYHQHLFCTTHKRYPKAIYVSFRTLMDLMNNPHIHTLPEGTPITFGGVSIKAHKGKDDVVWSPLS